MRVDGSGINDILRSSTGTEIKGQDTGKAGHASRSQAVSSGGDAYGVRSATVEKSFFSWESELKRLSQAASGIDVGAIHQQMAILSQTVSEEDLERMGQEGYSLNGAQVKTIVTVMDKIKLELAKGGMDISVFGDDLTMEQLSAMASSAGQAYQMAADLRQCTQEEAVYLVSNEQEPTIENLYRAQHSGSMARPSLPLPEDAGFQRQMAAIVEGAGLPVNDTTMGYGALLIQNDIPLTPENLSYLQSLMELSLPPEPEQALSAISEAVTEQRAPVEAYLAQGYSWKDRAMDACQAIQEAAEQDVVALQRQGQPVTIENLSRQPHSDPEAGGGGQKEPEPEDGKGQAVGPEEMQFLRARRQLEEIRLVMTAEANYRLLRRGVSIETVELEQLVEELKGVEDSYYKDLLSQQGIAPTEESVAMFRETAERTKELGQMSAYLLGRFLGDAPTIVEMHQAGRAMQAELAETTSEQQSGAKPFPEQQGRAQPLPEQQELAPHYERLLRAQASYESMMTSPRADMGDSIQKAFQNVDEILQDLQLDVSENNRRAVRILAYNQMELTVSHISQVKSLDEKVQQMFWNLKPAVVMEMIREGVSPLRMDIDALNAKANEIQQRLDPGGEESYSRYLWQMERQGQVTPQEREGYIGIYRLLRQIEKTDGAVIGAVASQGNELTLGNLLHAVRSRRARGYDRAVDAATGAAQEIRGDEAAIDRQIEAAYQTDCAKDALHNLSAQGVQQMVKDGSWRKMTPEQLSEALRRAEGQSRMRQAEGQSRMRQIEGQDQVWQIEGQDQVWQIEGQDQARQIEGQDQARQAERQMDYQMQMEQFAMGQAVEDRALRMLEAWQLPMDVYHMLAASRMLNQRNTTFRRLFSQENMSRDPELAEAQKALLERFGEAIRTPEGLAEAQKALADTAEHIMDDMLEGENATSVDVREWKLMRTELAISSRMSRDETYAIPVMIGDEMTNVQLKIVRGREKRGMVDIMLEHQRLGRLRAHIQVTEQKTEGFLVSDRQETISQLQGMQGQLQEQLKLSEDWQVRFDYLCQEGAQGMEYGMGERVPQEGRGEDYQIQTSRLYHVAKTFLDTLIRLS